MLLAVLSTGVAFAAAPATSDTGRTPNPKQTAQCNSEAKAKGLKRAERKDYLRTCMAGVSNSTASPQSMSGNDKPALETAKP